MNPIAFTGGLRVGYSYWNALNYTWPFAKLRFFADRIEIAGMFGSIRLKREQLVSVNAYRGLFSRGVQILHSSPIQQPFIVFWIKPAKVANAFREFGIEIQPTVKSASTPP